MLNNDYILRSDIQKAIGDWFLNDGDKRSMMQVFQDIPAADVEPKRKTGLWVGMREYCQHLFDTTGERYVMSQLGISLPHCNQCWAENESRKPFCPNCGAKMNVELPMEDSDAE